MGLKISGLNKRENFHNLECILILALYYLSLCFKMTLKYAARTAPALALVLEWRWCSAGYRRVQGMRHPGTQVEDNFQRILHPAFSNPWHFGVHVAPNP